MRTKTEAKRQQILAAAQTEFSHHGFHATTLDHVVRRMGSSKATIYNYFKTKEELFGAMLSEAAAPAIAALLQSLGGDKPLHARLCAYARGVVRIQTSDASIAVLRLLIGESDKLSATTRTLYDDPKLNGRQQLIDLFKTEQAARRLAEGECETMARQFGALLYGDLVVRRLLGQCDSFSDEEKDAAADAAVDCFLAAYRPL